MFALRVASSPIEGRGVLRGRACHAELAPFLRARDRTELGRTIDFPRAEELEARFGTLHHPSLRRSMSILELALHPRRRRERINARIRGLGGKALLVDGVAWAWTGQTEAERPGAVDVNLPHGKRERGASP